VRLLFFCFHQDAMIFNQPGKDSSRNLAFSQFVESAPAFAASEFTALRAIYSEARRWYSGEALDITLTDDNGDEYEPYPLRINPIPRACEKHAQALLGEDRNGEAISISVYDEDSQRIDTAENLLNSSFSMSDIDQLVLEGAISAQVDGGAFLIARWQRDERGEWGVRVEVVDAASMYVIPDADRWGIREAWLIRDIPASVAAAYGVVPQSPEEGYVSYYEHWTRDSHELLIDGKPIIPMLPNGLPLAQESFGVPIVYIPHERKAGEFWGRSLITDALKGVVKEINMRVADFGDAVARDASDVIVVRNVPGAIRSIRVSRTLSVIDIGSASGIPGKSVDPDMFAVQRQRANQPMSALIDELYKVFRREAVIPSVADGEDEGSQRSSLTLETRFWPLTTHIRMERRHWTRGLQQLAMIIFRILHMKGMLPSEDYMRIRNVRVEFGDILPRDREQLINELSVRRAANIGSLRHLMSLTGDIDDPDAEIEQIVKEQDLLQPAQPPAQETQNGPSDTNANRGNRDAGTAGKRQREPGGTGERYRG